MREQLNMAGRFGLDLQQSLEQAQLAEQQSYAQVAVPSQRRFSIFAAADLYLPLFVPILTLCYFLLRAFLLGLCALSLLDFFNNIFSSSCYRKKT